MTDAAPEGWASTAFREVVQPSREKAEPGTANGRTYLSLEHIESGTNRVLGHGNASDVKSTTNVFRSGDVLYGKLRPYLNKVVVPEFNGVCSTDILVFPRQERLESRLLMWFLSRHEVVQYADHNSLGTQLPRVSFGALGELPFPLPPRAEQRRIVEKVEALLARANAACDRLSKVPAILKRFRQAVLAAACSGRLTENWRDSRSETTSAEKLIASITELRRTRLARARKLGSVPRFDNDEPKLRDDLDLPELPREWTWVDLRFLMHEEEPFCYGVVQPGEDRPDGVPLIRAGDLHDLEGSLPGLRRIPVEVDSSYERSRIRGGEVLVTVVGANIGTVALAPAASRGFNIARAVAKVPIRDFSAEYVCLWLRTTIAQSWMVGDAREVARPTLNLEQLKTLPVPLPPRDEQEEIVRRSKPLLKLADAIEHRVAATASRADKLSQAILAKAFRGELVPTEAELARQEGREYEPASVLLERIRNERGTSVGKKPRPKHKRRGTSAPAERAAPKTRRRASG